MRHLLALFGMALAVALTACSNPQYLIHPSSNPTGSVVRQQIDNLAAMGRLQPLVWGSFLAPNASGMFKPLLPTDSRNAIVYVYRPQSEWSDNEVQAPGFFINGEFVSGLKSGSYFWFELPASHYAFAAKRPLAMVYLNPIFEADVGFEGGRTYYFRYDESAKGPETPEKGAALLVVGPLSQVAEGQALLEITKTRTMGVGRVLMADAQPRWAPFHVYADAQAAPADGFEATTDLPTRLRSEEELRAEAGDAEALTMKPMGESQWWNPLSW